MHASYFVFRGLELRHPAARKDQLVSGYATEEGAITVISASYLQVVSRQNV